MTSERLTSLACATVAAKSRQKSRSTSFQDELAGGDAVELLLEVGGEIELDVALEEILEEGGDDAALVLRHEALAVEAHIVALAQRLHRRGIGRGPADAELLHLLDERGLGVARRRLGEMLARVDLLALDALAGRHRGQAAAFLVVLVVAAFLVERQEAVEADDACRWRGASRRPPGSRASMSIVVRSSSADAIWLAIVRFQISS